MKKLHYSYFLPFLALYSLFFNLAPNLAFAADEEDLRFQVVDVQGKPSAYHDENDETSRLRKGKTVDDGDRITTDKNSRVVLRLKGKAYLQIAPNTKVHITHLRFNDNKRLQCRINLITGRILIQIDPGPPSTFEVTAGKLLCRAHGSLFDVSRNKEEVKMTAFEGSMVGISQGVVEMAKPRQVMKYENGRFRYKHYLKTEDEGRQDEWKGLLAEIREKQTQGGR